MKTTNNDKIYEYFFYLLCYINLYIDNKRDVRDIDEKLMNFVNRMIDVAIENKLFDLDKRFGDLYLDLESIVTTKTGFDDMMIEYKDFIESYAS